MTQTKVGWIGWAVWCGVSIVGCSEPPAEVAEVAPVEPETVAIETLTVAAVNYPLAFFAERIGGELVEVVLPIPADLADPALWRPSPEAIGTIQTADVILRNGAGYAKWTETVSLPASRVVDTSAEVVDRLVPLEGEVTHTHGPGGEHTHGGVASTVWVDPTLALAQAEAVLHALVNARPEAEAAMSDRFESLTSDLEGLDRRFEAAVSLAPDRPVVFSHPVYQYLIARYGLTARSVHWEPGEVPTPSQWVELDHATAANGAEWMVWEAAPLPEVAEELGLRGVGSVVFDLAANRPAEGDYLSIMTANAVALETVFAGGELTSTDP